MPNFIVAFEDVSFFGTDVDVDAVELTESEAVVLTERLKAEGALPDGVLAIHEAHLAVDDSVYEGGLDEDGQVKAFVSISLVIEADDEDEAYAFDTSGVDDLLVKVAEGMSMEVSNGCEGSWEVNDVSAAGVTPAP